MSNQKQQQLAHKLLGRMLDEMNSFIAMLEGLSVSMVLCYAQEYCLKQEVLSYLEEHPVSKKHAKALLSSPTPLADIVNTYEDIGCDYSDKIRDLIVSCAESKINSSLNRLKDRIERNLETFRSEWLSMSPTDLIGSCQMLDAVTRVAKAIPQLITEEDAEYLLRFKNPLQVIADEWYMLNDTILQSDMSHMLWSIHDRENA